MTKKRYRLALFLIALLVIISIMSILYNKSIEKTQKIYVENYKYIVKEYSGQIAVYKADEKEPLKTYDIFIENLPPVDQEELKKGITIKDDESLRCIIEDFTG
ncbi:MAG: BofC C-terminal domain-containing protein [Oscillospiraceae bacterium]